MRITVVDESATGGHSALHRASPITKLLAAGCLVAAVVVNANVLVLVGVALVPVAAVVAFRLPARPIAAFAAYPAVFGLIFALAAAPDALTAAAFVAKSVGAALAVIVLMFTTPYPQVFAPLQRVVPSIVGDALLLTYRSLFLLAEKFGNLTTAVRLRSGLASREPARAARATTAALGGLLLYSFDLSQREYDVMRLRGYDQRLRARIPRAESRWRDAVLLAVAAAWLAVAVVFRVGWMALNPISWLVPLLGVALVAVAALYRWRSSTHAD